MGALDAFRALMAELYLPILSEVGSWSRSTDKHTHAFLKVRLSFSVSNLTASVTSSSPVLVLFLCQKMLCWELVNLAGTSLPLS